MSKKRHHLTANPALWFTEVKLEREKSDLSPLIAAMHLYERAIPSIVAKGIGIADILFSLGLDNEAIVAALIYPLLQAEQIHTDFILEEFGEVIYKLVHDVIQMQSLSALQDLDKRPRHQLEILRKMLLSMVTDVRTVLIFLAERLWQLHEIKLQDPFKRKSIAQETLDLYAPLANRLGIWQLKWEIEDLCLRYLQPDIYSQIAKGLAARREERETYIKNIIEHLTKVLNQESIQHFQITGRVKHIYSIYKKMLRKELDLNQIYDISAVRVLVNSIDDCYTVLSVLHNHWPQFSEEFDDYIAHPKPNGYRSIHTVLIGPEEHYVEVQIRTYQMHHESELGVAAHWRYKEGILQTSSDEAKIALLRQIMAWQKEIVSTQETATKKPIQDLFADRVYVFTPTGDVIDLPQGATPLDFAYQIHSEVGHRCRGAKINGNIVPLTYRLQTGNRVEIMTAKLANPSRDWLNPHLGYIKTTRAKAKLQHWFRMQDSSPELAPEKITNKKIEAPEILIKTNRSSTNIHISGVDNLLTHMALCCKPIPGDAIIGYVTRHRGVSVHRRDCSNIPHVTQNNQARWMEVSFGEILSAYPADLLIKVDDRPGLLRDLTTFLASEKINVLGLQTQKLHDTEAVLIYLTIETKNKSQLVHAVKLLQQVPNVIEVRRR